MSCACDARMKKTTDENKVWIIHDEYKYLDCYYLIGSTRVIESSDALKVSKAHKLRLLKNMSVYAVY